MDDSGFRIWRSAREARDVYGATNYARMFGIVPGFFAYTRDAAPLWVPRSDTLFWLEDLLTYMWVWTREARGEHPDFMFSLGRKIEGAAGSDENPATGARRN